MRKLPALFSLLLFFACGKKNDPSPVVVQPASPSITSVMPDSNAVGSEVTITGANFSTVSAKDIVQFNGIAATVTQASATQLKVTVPTGASNGKITVSIGGQMATSAGNFFVLTGSWIQKADFAGGGRTRASGFSIGNNGYVIGAIPVLLMRMLQISGSIIPQLIRGQRKQTFPVGPGSMLSHFQLVIRATLGWVLEVQLLPILSTTIFGNTIPTLINGFKKIMFRS